MFASVGDVTRKLANKIIDYSGQEISNPASISSQELMKRFYHIYNSIYTYKAFDFAKTNKFRRCCTQELSNGLHNLTAEVSVAQF